MIPKSHFELGIAPKPEDIETLLRGGQRDTIPTHADIRIANSAEELPPSPQKVQALIYQEQLLFCVIVMSILGLKNRERLHKHISHELGFVLTCVGENLELKSSTYLRIAENALREFDRSLPTEIYEEVEKEVEETMQGIRICLQMGIPQKVATLKRAWKKLSASENSQKRGDLKEYMKDLGSALRKIGAGEIKFDRKLQEAMERDLNRIEMLLEEIASSTPSPSNGHSQSADRPNPGVQHS